MIKPSEQALNDFDEYWQWPLLVLSVAIIPLLLIPYTMQLSPAWSIAFRVADWVVYALFALEYFVRLYLAPKKRHFIVHNIPALALVIVPFLRPLRALRAVRALRLLRLTAALLLVVRAIKASRRALMRHGLAYVFLVAILIVVAGVIVIHEVEAGHPGSKISSWGDASWWTIRTVTTAGSETSWPASGMGQFMRVVLVLLGVSLFGLITASLTSWFVGLDEQKHVKTRKLELEQQLDELQATDEEQDKARQFKLEQRLDRLQATLDSLLAERAERSPPLKSGAPPTEDATKA